MVDPRSVQPSTVATKSAEARQDSRHDFLLAVAALAELQSRIFSEADGPAALASALQVLLNATGSAFGLIAESVSVSGKTVARILACTRIGKSQSDVQEGDGTHSFAPEFCDDQSIAGEILLKGKPIFDSDLSDDPRRAGFPAGHPAVNSVLGIPLRHGAQLIGVLILADHAEGACTLQVAEPLMPFFASMLAAWQNLRARHIHEKALRDSRVNDHSPPLPLSAGSNKLESLMTMAGGIAHDFNNLLTCMVGYCTLTEAELPPDSSALPMIREMEKAVRRASELTAQMLLYTGRTGKSVRALDLSLTMAELADVLKSAASDRAVLLLELASALPNMIADASQVRQLAINLVVNASESLQDRGGVIQIHTGQAEIANPAAQCIYSGPAAQPGNYVYLEVEDNGCGIPQDTLGRIFDPFFTTKFIGRGLGLAVVLGIARGHDALIQVVSQPGKGSRFRVLFPAAPSLSICSEELPGWAQPGEGMETILVVEEEVAVRMLVEQVLQRAGYNVLVAENGKQASRWLRDPIVSIDIVLIDLAEPNRGGIEAIAQMKKVRPDLRLFVMTSYSEQEARNRLGECQPAGFIQKPFSARGLITTLARPQL